MISFLDFWGILAPQPTRIRQKDSARVIRREGRVTGLEDWSMSIPSAGLDLRSSVVRPLSHQA